MTPRLQRAGQGATPFTRSNVPLEIIDKPNLLPSDHSKLSPTCIDDPGPVVSSAIELSEQTYRTPTEPPTGSPLQHGAVHDGTGPRGRNPV
jgi:hypothetical protein